MNSSDFGNAIMGGLVLLGGIVAAIGFAVGVMVVSLVWWLT